MRGGTRRRAVTATVLATALAAVSACTSSQDQPSSSGALSPPHEPQQRIIVWTVTTKPGDAGGMPLARFTADTDIGVKLVRVSPGDVLALLDASTRTPTSTPESDTGGAGGAGDTATPGQEQTGGGTSGRQRPDVIGGLSPPVARTLAEAGVTDSDAATAVVGNLGRRTLYDHALELVSHDGKPFAVPSDVWTQLLLYRKDVFADNHLPAPDTFGKLSRAVEKLDSKDAKVPKGMGGIAFPTGPDDRATRAFFEHLGLANGCRLVKNGKVNLSEPECADTFEFYADLARHRTGDGRDAASARAAYLSGKAAIVPASSGVLEAVGGLRAQQKPTCPHCGRAPHFLAKNSGVVAAVRGPHGKRPVRYGGISSWAITTSTSGDGAAEAADGAAKRFVSYMMGDGYLEWLGSEAGGGFPARKGTGDDPTRFTDAWGTLPMRGDGQSGSLADLYSAPVLALLRTGPPNFRRWSMPDGDGHTATAMRRKLPVADTLDRLVRSKLEPGEASDRLARSLRDLAHSKT